jgi:hypothetical protein
MQIIIFNLFFVIDKDRRRAYSGSGFCRERAGAFFCEEDSRRENKYIKCYNNNNM